MWDRKELQIENAKECARMGIITFEEAFEVFRAIRDGDDRIIEGLRRKRDDNKREADKVCGDARPSA